MDLYWFMPALAKRRVGSSWGTTLEEGQWVWPSFSKKATKVLRIFAAGHCGAAPFVGATVSASATLAFSSADATCATPSTFWPQPAGQLILESFSSLSLLLALLRSCDAVVVSLSPHLAKQKFEEH